MEQQALGGREEVCATSQVTEVVEQVEVANSSLFCLQAAPLYLHDGCS